MAEQGPGAISLRGIAREMGIASSALFRYFPTYNDLISALVADAYNEVADALTAVRDDRPPEDHTGMWFALCQAYRCWSLDNPAKFALLHGTPLPGYEAPTEVTGPVASRSIEVALDVYAAAVRAGLADPSRSEIAADFEVGTLWRSLFELRPFACEPRIAGIVLSAWTSVLGYLVVEIFGSLTLLVADSDNLFGAHVRTGMLGMGFNPNLIVSVTLVEAESGTF